MYSPASFMTVTSRLLRSTLLYVGGAIVLLLIVIVAAEPLETPAELTLQIGKLIQQLDDDLLETREEAARSLIKIGPAAISKLVVAAEDAAPERSRRAAEILKALARVEVGLRFASQVKRSSLEGAVTVALSPDGKFVYVPGYIAASINVFRRDATSGELKHQQTSTDPEQLAGVVTLHLNSTGKLAIAAACHSKSIALFSRDETTGVLSLLSIQRGEPVGDVKMEWPIGAIFSPDDKFVYAIDDRRGLVIVFQVDDGKSLKLVEIFKGPDNCFDGARGITAHPDGKTLYVTSHRAGTLVVLNRDTVTGRITIRQILRDEQDGIHGLAGTIWSYVSRDGKFLYTTSGRFEGDNAVSVFQVGADGTLKVLQEFIAEKSALKNFEGGAVGITVTPDGKSLYVSGAKSRSLACFTRDPLSGKLTGVTTLQSLGTGKAEEGEPQADLGAMGIGVSADGKFLYLALENGSAISVFERLVPVPRPKSDN